MHRLNGASGSAEFSVIIIVKRRNQLQPNFRTIRGEPTQLKSVIEKYDGIQLLYRASFGPPFQPMGFGSV
jgi:hypothetical protein